MRSRVSDCCVPRKINIYIRVGFVKEFTERRPRRLRPTCYGVEVKTQKGSRRIVGSYANGRARREAILDAAAEHFAQRGFGAATVLEIAAACGISRAGLLHHFPDKETLLAAVLEHRDAQDRARFRPYAAIPDGIGVLTGIADLAEHNQLVPGLIELFVRLSAEASAPEHPAHEYFVRRYHRITRGTQEAIAAAQKAGYVMASVDPSDAGVQLTAYMDGLQFNWLMDRELEMGAHMSHAIRSSLTKSGRSRFDEISARLRTP